MRHWQLVHFEHEEANASWFCGPNGIVGCRWLELSSWFCCRVAAKPLIGSFLLQNICERRILYLLLSQCCKSRWQRVCWFLSSLLFYDWGVRIFGLQNLEDFPVGGMNGEKSYGIIGPWAVWWPLGEVGWSSEREDTEAEKISHFQDHTIGSAKTPSGPSPSQNIYHIFNNCLAQKQQLPPYNIS